MAAVARRKEEERWRVFRAAQIKMRSGQAGRETHSLKSCSRDADVPEIATNTARAYHCLVYGYSVHGVWATRSAYLKPEIPISSPVSLFLSLSLSCTRATTFTEPLHEKGELGESHAAVIPP